MLALVLLTLILAALPQSTARAQLPASHTPAAPRIVTQCAPPTVPDASAVQLTADILYRTRGADSLRVDIARPAAAAETGAPPVVLLVHGGGWRGGDRSSRLRDQLLRLAGRGYAAASIDYRLTTDKTNRYPAAMEDVVCAVRWLRARQRDYGIDAARMVVMGESAGGQLSGLLGTVPDLPTFASDCEYPGSARVLGVISMFGILELRSARGIDARVVRVIEDYLGGTAAALSEKAREGSPLAHANPQAAPFLLIHGTDDESVPPVQSQWMRDSLRRAGVPATYLEVSGQGHGFPMLSEAPQLRVSTCSALAFLADVLRP
jgi:acetyl esterase/lipase